MDSLLWLSRDTDLLKAVHDLEIAAVIKRQLTINYYYLNKMFHIVQNTKLTVTLITIRQLE